MSRMLFYLNVFQAIKKKIEADPDYFKNKQHQVPIYLDYSFGQRLRITTKIFVNPNDWDQEKQRVKGTDPEAGLKNDRLTIIKERLYKAESSAIANEKRLSIDYMKQNLSPGIQIKGHYSSEKFFLDCWNRFIKGNSEMNDNTKRNYDNTLIVLKDFCQKNHIKLTFDGITLDFFQDLKNYFATDRKITGNTVGKYTKNIKAFMNHCTKKGLNNNLDFKKFEIRKDPKIITFLTLDELRQIKNLDLDNDILQLARDLFIFSCFSGLRYSDTQNITPSNVRDGYIIFTTVKTKKPQYTPLTPQADEILQKFGNHLPKLTIHVYNEAIKKLGEKAGMNEPTSRIRYIGSDPVEETRPRYKFFSSHLAKRTFISLFFRSGGRIDTIMKTTGNKDRKTMNSYLEILDKDVKEESDRIFNQLEI